MARRRALVTGASGFVGRYLVPLLQKKGYQVWCSSRGRKTPFRHPVCWIKSDLESSDEILNLVKKARPDIIFHLAGLANPKESLKRPDTAFSWNVRGTIFLLEAMLRVAPNSTILLVSSSHVYGRVFDKIEKIREEYLINPASPYGASKALMEMAAQDYARQTGLRVIIARSFNHLGAGQPPSYIFSDFCRQISGIERKKRAARLEVGNLDLIRDFIHVEDAVRAYLILGERGKSGTTYNVGSGEGIRLSRGLEYLRRASHASFKIKPAPSRFRRQDPPSIVADCRRLKRLGWRPRKTIREGLQDMLSEWRQKV